jgi:hypothetical protein
MISEKINRDDLVYFMDNKSVAITYNKKTFCFSKDDPRFLGLVDALENGRSFDFLQGTEAMNTLMDAFDIG